MKPLFFSWWRAIVINHLKSTVSNENIELKSELPSDTLPYLTLSWIINNRGGSKITVYRVYGCAYMGNKRILVFDVHEPVNKVLGVNLQQYLTIRETGTNLEIEINWYPSIEFWISNQNNHFVIDGFVEVCAYGEKVRISLETKRPLKINNISQATLKYRETISEYLNSILKVRK